jgi:hypothetical protein
VANARVHGTTGERPDERWARDEQPVLQPLASRVYHSLVLTPRSTQLDVTRRRVPPVDVERRPLAAYTSLFEEVHA